MIKKNTWINNILFCIKQFANSDYQERAWVKYEIHWPCDFGEIMCSLFDDAAVEEFIKKADEFNLSWKQKRSLSKFIQSLDKYGDNLRMYTHTSPPMLDGAKMVSDPEWKKIQKMAQKVLDAFEEMKYAPENREAWLDSILSRIYRYSDIEDQKKMWVNKSEAFFATPRDFYDGLFMYGDFDSFIDGYVEQIGLSKQQVEALKKFYVQIKMTPFKTAEYEGILNHPDWQKLQALAKETLEQFPKKQ